MCLTCHDFPLALRRVRDGQQANSTIVTRLASAESTVSERRLPGV